MATKKSTSKNSSKAKAKREFKQRDPSAKPNKAGYSVAGTLKGMRPVYSGPAGKDKPAKHQIFHTWLNAPSKFDAAAMAKKYPNVTENVIRAWVSAWRNGRGKFIAKQTKLATAADKKRIAAAQKA